MARDPSVWEENARAEKTRKIVEEIDRQLGSASLDAPAGIARWLRSLDAAGWKQLGLMAKVLPPSPTTQTQVLRVFDWRADKLRRKTPPVIVSPAIDSNGE